MQLQRFLKTVPVGARIGSDIAKEYGLVFRRPSDLGEKRNQMLKNCFFSSVAFHVSNLRTATSPHSDIVNHLNSMGLSADMAITELARALRALIVEEWTGPNAEEYMNFIEEDVDFN